MAISGIENINIGLQNQAAGSDSLYTAFNKSQNNFTTLFSCASPTTNFVAGNGVAVSYSNSNTYLTITNTGVTNLVAGDSSIVLTQSNGNITITAPGGGNGGGGVSNINVIGAASGARITSTGGPIITSGIITLDLANSGVTAGTYTYPTVTVDQYGRVTSIANANSAGTVTSVGVTTTGAGIQISGSPVTTAGNITIINTGVTRLNAGSGISLSSSNGNITVSTTAESTGVTSVGISSTSLTVTNSPITSTGTMTVDLPTNTSIVGNLAVGNNLSVTGTISGNISGSLANGTSNVSIPAVNSTINMVVAGTTRIAATSTGANITGIANISGNIYTTGNVGINTNAPDSELNILAIPQTVSYPVTGNSTTLGTDLHISGSDGSNTRITQDAFGTGSYVAFTGRSARGTAATPTQTQSGDILTQYTARGFSNGSLQFGNTSTGRVDIVAAESFTDTARGTKVVINTTPTGSITPAAIANFEANGAVTLTGQLISNIAVGTAPFVVTSTTQVANLSVATAGSATTAGTVTTAAQPNITSVGTLTTLTSGNVTGTGFILSNSKTQGVGYATGAGSTGTQATSRSTAVAMAVPCVSGSISLFSTTTTANTWASFAVSNVVCTTSDLVLLNARSSTTANSYIFNIIAVGANTFTVQIYNAVAVAVAEAPSLGFAIIKGATA